MIFPARRSEMEGRPKASLTGSKEHSKVSLPVPAEGYVLLALLVHEGAIRDADEALQSCWRGCSPVGKRQRQGEHEEAPPTHHDRRSVSLLVCCPITAVAPSDPEWIHYVLKGKGGDQRE